MGVKDLSLEELAGQLWDAREAKKKAEKEEKGLKGELKRRLGKELVPGRTEFPAGGYRILGDLRVHTEIPVHEYKMWMEDQWLEDLLDDTTKVSVDKKAVKRFVEDGVLPATVFDLEKETKRVPAWGVEIANNG